MVYGRQVGKSYLGSQLGKDIVLKLGFNSFKN